MSETEAAAGRLRRICAGENFAAVYGIENQVRERATFVDPRVLELHHADEQTVIAEYLALVRPDDATRLDEAWLRSVGFTIRPYSGGLGCRADIETCGSPWIALTIFTDGRPSICTDHSQLTLPIWDHKTAVRSDVRDLARVLGIPLTGDVQ